MFIHSFFIMFTLLLLSLLHSTTCTVYTVTPDDPNTICHHCYNLQHYLLNATKYFTSNTQLLFLPGIHHLHTDLIIRNARNISLNGIANSTTQDVVLHCNRSGGVLMVNINHLTISNISIQECNNDNSHLGHRLNVALIIKYCNFVTVYQINVSSSTILGINILGDSYFSYVTCDGMEFLFFEEKQLTKLHNTISVDHYHHSKDTRSLLLLTARQNYYQIVLKLPNINEKICKVIHMYFMEKTLETVR